MLLPAWEYSMLLPNTVHHPDGMSDSWPLCQGAFAVSEAVNCHCSFMCSPQAGKAGFFALLSSSSILSPVPASASLPAPTCQLWQAFGQIFLRNHLLSTDIG